ncbi:hypothetical protein [Nocardioides alcanivorans]|nr:hypothetical protein [Nocardioides alcanivorans]
MNLRVATGQAAAVAGDVPANVTTSVTLAREAGSRAPGCSCCPRHS